MRPRTAAGAATRRTPRITIACCLLAVLVPPSAAFAQLRAEIAPAGIHAGQGARSLQQRNSQLAASELPYHYGAKLVCTECHFTGMPRDTVTARGLTRPDPIKTCLRCHDGVRGIPDVVGDDVNGLAERSGGFFAAPNQPNPGGHDLTNDGIGVTCIDCHDPHGNGNPRNLTWASNPSQTPPLGLFTSPSAKGVRRYERANTAYATLNSDAMREVSSMCIDCHHDFSGLENTGGVDHYTRHPSYDSERAGGNRVLDGVGDGATAPWHWEEGRGAGFDGNGRVPFVTVGATDYASAARVSARSNGVFCLSCHKAHGSASAHDIVWNTRVPAARSGCNQCHNIGPGDDTRLTQR